MVPQKTKNQTLRPSRRVWLPPQRGSPPGIAGGLPIILCTLLFAGGSVGAVRRVAGPSVTAGTAACARITSGAGITPLFAGAIAGAAAVLAAGILAVAGLITGIGIVSAGNRSIRGLLTVAVLRRLLVRRIGGLLLSRSDASAIPNRRSRQAVLLPPTESQRCAALVDGNRITICGKIIRVIPLSPTLITT